MATRVAAVELQGLRHAEDVRRLYDRLRRSICQSLRGLADALEARDAYARGHSQRVGAWGRRLAESLGLPPDQVDGVSQAGLLHDIGTIGVPEAVLGQRGPLEADQWTLMRNHPVIGAQIVAPFEFFPAGALIIRHHHERWDGSGYPDGLRGHAIPLGARIIAAADVFDALTSERPYRPACARDAALAHLSAAAGRTLDPDVVAALLGLVRLDDPV
jgi:HD-GYP domain-containing protein (c-di-GMP phosphodiesterase class II)